MTLLLLSFVLDILLVVGFSIYIWRNMPELRAKLARYLKWIDYDKAEKQALYTAANIVHDYHSRCAGETMSVKVLHGNDIHVFCHVNNERIVGESLVNLHRMLDNLGGHELANNYGPKDIEWFLDNLYTLSMEANTDWPVRKIMDNDSNKELYVLRIDRDDDHQRAIADTIDKNWKPYMGRRSEGAPVIKCGLYTDDFSTTEYAMNKEAEWADQNQED
jgi:hypothetical protein